MPKLTPEERQDRLRFDYRVVMHMHMKQMQKSKPVMQVFAFRNPDDLAKRRNPILSEDQGHLATHYLVDYSIRTLIGPDAYSDKTTISFDLQANGNYPFSMPGVFVVESETPHPWTPHFRSGLPVCIDHDWWQEGGGTILLGQLLVHVAKLLNFDEIPRTANYGGYTPEAADHWRKKLNRQPITADMDYPALPAEIINLIVEPPKGRFRPISPTPLPPEQLPQSFRSLFSPSDQPRAAETPQADRRLQEAVSGPETARVANPLFSPKSAQPDAPSAVARLQESNADSRPLFKPRGRN
jgi:hypothetical protein